MSTPLLKRTGQRGWVTKRREKLAELLEADPPVISAIEDAIKTLDSQVEKLNLLQGEVEATLDTEDSLMADIDSAAKFEEITILIRRRAFDVLSKVKDKSSLSDKSYVDSSFLSSPSTAKFPKIELPHFSGDVLDWTSFWESFTATIDSSSEHADVTKYTYLRSLLQGDALKTISGLSLTASNYKIAKDLLIERFGRKEKIIFNHITCLTNISKTYADCADTANLWEFYDNVQSHIRALEALEVKGDKLGIVLTPMLLSSVPSELRLEWSREGEGKESDLQFLLDFLKREVVRRERSETFSKPDVLNSAKTLTSHSKGNSTSKVCLLCKKSNHAVSRCFKLTKTPIEQRRDLLIAANICCKCLSSCAKGSCHSPQACQAKWQIPNL